MSNAEKRLRQCVPGVSNPSEDPRVVNSPRVLVGSPRVKVEDTSSPQAQFYLAITKSKDICCRDDGAIASRLKSVDDATALTAVVRTELQRAVAFYTVMTTAVGSCFQGFITSTKKKFAAWKFSSRTSKVNMAQVSTAALPGGLDSSSSPSEACKVQDIPQIQKHLLLHAKGQPYQVHEGGTVPKLAFGDLLVEVHAIGLNPIDWKSAYVLL